MMCLLCLLSLLSLLSLLLPSPRHAAKDEAQARVGHMGDVDVDRYCKLNNAHFKLTSICFN